eukprot:scaffold260565_cov32-Tisochrysis_lutea.AAC.1
MYWKKVTQASELHEHERMGVHTARGGSTCLNGVSPLYHSSRPPFAENGKDVERIRPNRRRILCRVPDASAWAECWSEMRKSYVGSLGDSATKASLGQRRGNTVLPFGQMPSGGAHPRFSSCRWRRLDTSASHRSHAAQASQSKRDHFGSSFKDATFGAAAGLRMAKTSGLEASSAFINVD